MGVNLSILIFQHFLNLESYQNPFSCFVYQMLNFSRFSFGQFTSSLFIYVKILIYFCKMILIFLIKRRIQNPDKHLRQGVLQEQLTAKSRIFYTPMLLLTFSPKPLGLQVKNQKVSNEVVYQFFNFENSRLKSGTYLKNT